MSTRHRWTGRLAIVAMGAAMAVVCGCRGSSEPTGPAATPAPAPASPAPAEKPKEKVPIEVTVKPEPVATTMPKVEMTESLRATCRVGEGDPLPDGQVRNLEGKSVAVRSLLGEKATVVFFFTRGETRRAQLTAQAALHDLQKDVAEVYAAEGVEVLAVDQKNADAEVAELAAAAGVTFPVLTDPAGRYFGTIATKELPRLYLVDPEGKILWFDIGYSETTRRSLKQALQVVVGK